MWLVSNVHLHIFFVKLAQRELCSAPPVTAAADAVYPLANPTGSLHLFTPPNHQILSIDTMLMKILVLTRVIITG